MDLNKSLDALIDELFAAEEEKIEKSMAQDIKPDTKADSAVSKTEKAEDDAKRGAGRPKQISEVPETDEDGKRDGKYDDDITEEKSDKDAKRSEESQVKAPEHIAKSEVLEISEEEWNEFQAFKKSKEVKKVEEPVQKSQMSETDLRKAVLDGSKDLIKSIVGEATAKLREENQALKKSLEENTELVKAMANKPQKSKAVTNVSSVEKFQKSEPSSYSTQEVLDVCEDLIKSGKLQAEHGIELETTGFIYDKEARDVLERELRKR